MKKLNLFLMLTLFGFGVMVQTAQAQITAAPTAKELRSGQGATGSAFNARFAIAPYAQVTANATYTFIGISHPSLNTAHTSIGIAVEAIDMATVPDTSAGRASIFTVNAGETHRVFIVNQSHPTINANNTAFTDSKTHLITTTDASQFGNIRVVGIGTEPSHASLSSDRPGRYTHRGGNATGTVVYRFDNLAQLSMWGVVYQSSNGAGFALEFIGDMHDSSVAGNTIVYEAQGHTINDTNSTGVGRGIN